MERQTLKDNISELIKNLDNENTKQVLDEAKNHTKHNRSIK